jgi:hypothetical protein
MRSTGKRWFVSRWMAGVFRRPVRHTRRERDTLLNKVTMPCGGQWNGERWCEFTSSAVSVDGRRGTALAEALCSTFGRAQHGPQGGACARSDEGSYTQAADDWNREHITVGRLTEDLRSDTNGEVGASRGNGKHTRPCLREKPKHGDTIHLFCIARDPQATRRARSVVRQSGTRAQCRPCGQG